jgi:acyl carrier protein
MNDNYTRALIICPDLSKISKEVISKAHRKVFNEDIDFNLSFGDNQYDDLDMVEFIMEIEKILDIAIDDDACELVLGLDNIPINLIYEVRDIKIDKILNNGQRSN